MATMATGLNTFDLSLCDSLPPRKRAICRGEAGIQEHKRTEYLLAWGIVNNAERNPTSTGSRKPRGLGDTIAAITHATGIDRVVKAVTGGRDCGCGKRQAALNRMFPYAKKTAPVTVIVTTHNYARYLGECLDSIDASTVAPAEVIVIDDASDDDPASVCRPHMVRCERVEFRDVHLVRRHALASVTTKYVLFLDADNKLDPSYLETSIAQLEADRNAAFAFPVLLGFGDKSGPMYRTDAAPDVITWQDIERQNRCDTGSVIRTEVLRQSLALECDSPASRRTQDWRIFRQMLRSGPWHAVKSIVPLLYRVHPEQVSQRERLSYYHEADLEHETVTVVVPFSGRWAIWGQLQRWLIGQTWPRDQTRLLIVNTTHQPLSVADIGLEQWEGAGIAIERLDVGQPRLAEQERRGKPQTQREVEAAVAGIFNRAATIAYGEYVLTLEDDVIPQRADAIDVLMRSMGHDVAAVSGVYRHRYQNRACAFHGTSASTMIPLDGPEIEQVGGSGFGCLLVRRSVLLSLPLSGDDSRRPHYDVDFGVRCREQGLRWILHRGVKCDHLTGTV